MQRISGARIGPRGASDRKGLWTLAPPLPHAPKASSVPDGDSVLGGEDSLHSCCPSSPIIL